MQVYKVKITETLQRIIEVEAVSADDALNFTNKMWLNGEVVLTADDYVDKELEVIDE